MIKIFPLVVATTLLMTGCAASINDRHFEGSTQIHGDDPVKELAALSAETLDELRLLAKTRDFEQYIKLSPEQRNQRRRLAFIKLPGFEQEATLTFNGQAHVLAETLAKAAGYDFIKPISNPAKPLIVSIEGENKKLSEYLKELSAKIGRLGAIRVHTSPRKTLEFSYATENTKGVNY